MRGWSGVTRCPGWTCRHRLHRHSERFTMRDHSAGCAAMPDVICPHCGRSKAVTAATLASIAGKTIRCSGCKAEFVVEDRGPLDFLDARTAPEIPPKNAPTLSKEQREAFAEQNVADYKASKTPWHKSSLPLSVVYAIGKTVVWLFVAFLAIEASTYSGSASSGGIGVLVFVASLIALLLTQVINLLLRIVRLLEKD